MLVIKEVVEMVWDTKRNSWRRVARINNLAYVIELNADATAWTVVEHADLDVSECTSRFMFIGTDFKEAIPYPTVKKIDEWSARQ